MAEQGTSSLEAASFIVLDPAHEETGQEATDK